MAESRVGQGGAALDPGNPKDSAGRGKRSGVHILSTILIVLGVLLLLVAGVLWGMAQWRYHQQAVINEKLAEYAEISDTPSQAPVVDWAGLKAINDEVVAWLQIPGTTINYPVYQGSDNVRYLRHNAEGDWTVGGQLFIDYENTAPGMVDEQTIVYGHHLDDGSMFEQVAALDDQAAFDATGTVWYVTEDVAWELEPLFMYYTQAEDSNARRFTFASIDEFHRYLLDLLGRAVTRRADAAQLLPNITHVLTLSTCNYYDGYGRSLLVCVPKNEAREAVAGGVTGIVGNAA